MGFKADYRLMQAKSIAECSKLSTCIKVPSVFKTFVLSILSARLRQVLLYAKHRQLFPNRRDDSGLRLFFLISFALCIPSKE